MGKYEVADMLKHAVEIEEAGQKFYTTLAERLDNEPLAKIFAVMARQEIGHLETYKNLQEQLPASPEASPAGTDDFDYQKHKILEDRIFNRLDIVRKAPGIKTLGDALGYMIDIEMDVVDYFENARKLITAAGQPLMIKIINEEKAHVKQLLDLRKQYQSVSLR